MIFKKAVKYFHTLSNTQVLFFISILGYISLCIYGLLNYKSRLLQDSSIEILSYYNDSIFYVLQYRVSPLLNKPLLALAAFLELPVKTGAIMYVLNDMLFYPIIALFSYMLSRKLIFPTWIFLQVLLVHKQMYFGIYHEIVLTASLNILFIALFYSKLKPFPTILISLIISFFLSFTHPISVLLSIILIALVAIKMQSKLKLYTIVAPFALLVFIRLFFIDVYDYEESSKFFLNLANRDYVYVIQLLILSLLFYPFLLFNIYNWKKYTGFEKTALVATLLLFVISTFAKEVIFISPEFPKLGLPLAVVSIYLLFIHYKQHFTSRIARYVLVLCIVFSGFQIYLYGFLAKNHVAFVVNSIECAKMLNPDRHKWFINYDETIYCDVLSLTSIEAMMHSLIKGDSIPYAISKVGPDNIELIIEGDTDSTYFGDNSAVEHESLSMILSDDFEHPNGYYKELEFDVDSMNQGFPPDMDYCSCIAQF